MANILQGAPMPNITTTQTTASTAPEWYSNYLSGIPSAPQTQPVYSQVAPVSSSLPASALDQETLMTLDTSKGSRPPTGELGTGFELPTFPKGFEAENFGPPPTHIYQGNNKTDYSKYGFSSGLQDFFKDQTRPEDLGGFNYDIASGTFGMGGIFHGPKTAGQPQYDGMRGIPKDVMEKYIASGQDGSSIDMSQYKIWDGKWAGDSQTPTPTPTPSPLTAQSSGYNPNPNASLAENLRTAASQGGAAGASGLQSLAYGLAPYSTQAGQPYLQQGAEALNKVSGTPTSSLIQDYLNPYTQGVVGEINRLGQQQFRETLAPGVTAGAAGSGQFGSKRGMQTYGNVARDVNANILGKQTEALNTGFQNAVTAAQQQQKLGLDTGTAYGQLSTNAYNQGIGGLNALSTLGAQQQATEQARLNYPMQAESNIAKVIGGLNIPMSTTQTYTGPIPGAYQQPLLSQLIGTGSSIAGIFADKTDANGKTIPGTSLWNSLKNIPGMSNFFNSSNPSGTIGTGGGAVSSDTPGGTQSGGDLVGDPLAGSTYAGTDANGNDFYWNANANSFINGSGNLISNPDMFFE